MILFKCSKCGEQLEAPQSLAGQSVECPKCNLHEKVPTPIVPLDSIDGPKKASRNFLAASWHSIPKPFKNTFLGTLGIISALWLFLFLVVNLNQSKDEPTYREPVYFEVPQSYQEPVYNTEPQYPDTAPRPETQQSSTNGIKVESFDLKRLSTTKYYHKYSWKARLSVDRACSIDVHVVFKDRENFNLEEFVEYGQKLMAGKYSVLSGTALIDADIAKMIDLSKCTLYIEKN